ncbi:hypothetical protein [Mesorhizobium sp. RIZ17]
MTYGRRYSIMALLGLTAKEEDDDVRVNTFVAGQA